MNPIALALFAALVGAAIGAALMVMVTHGRRPQPASQGDEDSSLAAAIRALHTTAALVGEHDDVVAASPVAESTGFVRGTRLAHAAVLDAVRQSRREGRGRELELPLPRGSAAEPLVLAVHVEPLDDRLLVLADDASAQRRFDATRRDFVANITHELKTPIGAIALMAEAVDGAADDEIAVRRFAGKIGAEASRLNELVSQIITLSQLQSQEPLAGASRVDLVEVVQESLGAARHLAEARGATLAFTTDGACQVFGDPRQLMMAVGNLVENAISYSEPGARVAVSVQPVTRDGEKLVQVSVSDNGIGIAADDLERVFERFYRVDYGRSRATGGTGLGLSIVKHVAEAHGGDVAAWSKLGSGSTFTITLPASAESTAEVSP